MRESSYTPNQEEMQTDEARDQKKKRGVIDQIKYALKVGVLVGGTMLGAGAATDARAEAGAQPQTEQKERQWTEGQERQLRGMWNMANEKVMQLDSTYFSATQENLPTGVVDLFQKKGSEMAEAVVAQGGTTADFEAQLDGLYQVFYKSLLGQHDVETDGSVQKEAQPEKKAEAGPRATLEIDLPQLPDSAEMNYDWMWQNVGKAFQRDGKVIAIASAQSRDMQMSVDKADMVAAGVATDIFKTVTIMENGVSTKSSGMLRGGRELGRQTRQQQGVYETVIMMQFDAVVSTQSTGK